MRLYLICFLCFLGYTPVVAQLSDIARIEYTYIPKGNASMEFTRARALFNYPIKLNEEKESYILLGLDYSNIKLIFDEDVATFEKRTIEDFQLLDFNLGYTFKMNDDWRFGARFVPGFSSNLKASTVGLKDVVFSGDLVFVKDKKEVEEGKKPYRLIVGITYSQNRGFPFPLPFISYYRKFHEKWSYNVGVPKMNLQYHYSPKCRIKAELQLDGFNSNIQEGLAVNNTEVARQIRMALLVGGLRYEYKFTKHLELFVNGSYILSNRVKLQNSSRDNIFTLSNDNSFYLRSGLRLKI